MIFHSTPTYMTDYPFIVMAPRSRLVKITSNKFSNALSRALSLHPNKFLKTQFARRMDLVSAQDEAKRLSQKSGHKQYVILLKSGDFEVENALSIEPKMDIYSVWHKGKKVEGPVAKIKLSPQDEEPPVAKAPKRAELPTKKELVKEVKQTNKETKQKEQNEKISKTKNEEIMKTEAKKSPAKKAAAKKEAPKKLAKAAKSTTPVKKSNDETQHPRFRPIVGGAALTILDALKKGKALTKEALAKLADTKVGNIAWYIGKIKNNGHKVEATESGYKLKK